MTLGIGTETHTGMDKKYVCIIKFALFYNK